MKKFGCLLSLLIAVLLIFSAYAEKRPHILLIVADDLGYSDLGCYGGEIDTPRIDRLAEQGVRFTRYHVNPMCVVTRTSLMTGQTYSQSDHFRRSLPIAHLMKQAGYATSIIGKWHQPGNPVDAGFDYFYGFLGGEIDAWSGKHAGQYAIQTNHEKPGPVPEGWYSSDAFTDHAIAQIDEAVAQGKPFFTYVAFNAPHSPLLAPRDNVVKYYDRYRAGWEKLRQQRYARMKKMDLIDDRYVMVPPQGEVRRWDELPPKVQALESRRMSAYAGMVDRLDHDVGRLLDHLHEKGLDNNTLVLFMSDNGGDYSNGNIKTDALALPWKPNGGGTIPYASNGWAYLKCTPFRWYKSSAQGGGVSVPFIVRWPGQLASPPGSILQQRLHVTDLYPTFMTLAGETYPAKDGTRKLAPLYGHSMLPLFHDPSMSKYAIHDEIFWAFNSTGKGLERGDWKIASISDGPWQLYNVAKDPAESTNLAATMPEMVKTLSDRWFDFAENHTAMPPDWREPIKAYQEGWGFHRMRMVMPAYRYAEPHEAQTDVPLDTDLAFHFSKPISFAHSTGKTIRLYSWCDPHTPVWQADPKPCDPAEGKKTPIFDDLPRLKPDTTYFVLSDPGWITLGGKPAEALNDGAYWYRFRTGK